MSVVPAVEDGMEGMEGMEGVGGMSIYVLL